MCELREPTGPERDESQCQKSCDELPTKEIFLPIHGFVRLYEREWKVIDHPAFQRLGFFYELGQTHTVYPGAAHKRKEHVLGALYLAEKICRAIDRNKKRFDQKKTRHSSETNRLNVAGRKPEWEWDDALSKSEIAFIRVAALLHDIGHLPMGHTLEDEVGLIKEKHDGNQRIRKIFEKITWDGEPEKPLKEILDKEFEAFAPNPYKASDIILSIIRNSNDDKNDHNSPCRLHSKKTVGSGEKKIRIGVCRNIVGDTICTDLLDYLQRDWHHIGKTRLVDKRLFQYMEIRRWSSNPSDENHPPEFVISLGERPRLKTDAVTSILMLLQHRYELHEYVILHRTKLAATSMLSRVLQELNMKKIGWQENFVDQILEKSDEQVLELLLVEARKEFSTDAEKSIWFLLHKLKWRRLHKLIYVEWVDDVEPEAWRRIYDKHRIAKNRIETERLLEKDFQLKPGDVTIYCPADKAMSAKVPKVKLYLDGNVRPFEEWEKEVEISDGMVEALNERFRKLCRIFFFVNNSIEETTQRLLRTTIKDIVLGQAEWSDKYPRSLETASRRLAKELLDNNDSLRASYTISEDAQNGEKYPSGAPTLFAWLKKRSGEDNK